jgi:hypothetical protein
LRCLCGKLRKTGWDGRVRPRLPQMRGKLPKHGELQSLILVTPTFASAEYRIATAL